MAGWARLPGARARCEPRGASATTRSVLHRRAARRAASARGAAANSYARQRGALTHGRCAPPNSRTCPCRLCSAPLAPLACTARQPLSKGQQKCPFPVCAPKEPPKRTQMTLLDLLRISDLHLLGILGIPNPKSTSSSQNLESHARATESGCANSSHGLSIRAEPEEEPSRRARNSRGCPRMAQTPTSTASTTGRSVCGASPRSSA